MRSLKIRKNLDKVLQDFILKVFRLFEINFLNIQNYKSQTRIVNDAVDYNLSLPLFALFQLPYNLTILSPQLFERKILFEIAGQTKYNTEQDLQIARCQPAHPSRCV